MDYLLTEEQIEIKELAKRVAEEKILPIREEYDKTGEFPWEVIKALKEADLCGVYIPEEYGGFGGGSMGMCLVTEELSKVCAGISLAFAATGLGCYPIILHGSEEQKQKYLSKIASGDALAAFALTEAEAGSDVSNVRTIAKKEGDYYILNGTKQWITNGGEADIYTVFALTSPEKGGARGMTAFIVEKGTPGFTFGKKEEKMGIRASATRELIFQDCKVPAENVLGKVNRGFKVVMDTFDKSRPGVAAQALGIATGALEAAVKYSKERKQFGENISSFQGIQFMMANMATKIEAARALIYSVCRMIDAGDFKNLSRDAAMAKLFASDVAMEVTVDAVQIMGGYGYMKDYPVEKMMRDAKITQIYEGTNQIQQIIIARHLIKDIK